MKLERQAWPIALDFPPVGSRCPSHRPTSLKPYRHADSLQDGELVVFHLKERLSSGELFERVSLS